MAGDRGAKPAVQHRSQKTRDALIAALDALLREKSFADIEVTEIAARAGVSPATVYQRFTNREAATAILMELNIRKVAEWGMAERAAVARIQGAPTLRAAMLELGAMSWRQCAALRTVMRPAYLHSMLRPDLFGEEWRSRMEGARADGFQKLLEAHRDEIARTDIPRAAGAVAALVNMMFAGILLHGGDDAPPGGSLFPDSEEAFARELADAVCGYLAMPDAIEGERP